MLLFLRRRHLSYSECAAIFTACGRPLDAFGIRQHLKRLAKEGYDVPIVPQTEAMKRLAAKPEFRETCRRVTAENWKRGVYDHLLPQIRSLRTGTGHPQSKARNAFLDKLRQCTDLPPEERIRIADQYFPRLAAEAASELGASQGAPATLPVSSRSSLNLGGCS